MSGNVDLFDNAIVAYVDNLGLVRYIEQLSRKKTTQMRKKDAVNDELVLIMLTYQSNRTEKEKKERKIRDSFFLTIRSRIYRHSQMSVFGIDRYTSPQKYQHCVCRF